MLFLLCQKFAVSYIIYMFGAEEDTKFTFLLAYGCKKVKQRKT